MCVCVYIFILFYNNFNSINIMLKFEEKIYIFYYLKGFCDRNLNIKRLQNFILKKMIKIATKRCVRISQISNLTFLIPWKIHHSSVFPHTHLHAAIFINSVVIDVHCVTSVKSQMLNSRKFFSKLLSSTFKHL